MGVFLDRLEDKTVSENKERMSESMCRQRFNEMNLVLALQLGLIDWFQYFDLYKKLGL